MAVSRRSFVRTVGLGGVSAAFVAARGREALFSAGLSDGDIQAAQAANAPPKIKISSNENPRGPSPAVLEAIRGRTTYGVGRYPDNIDALTEAIAKMYGAKPENVWLGTGSGPELTAAARAFLSPTKHLVTGDPSYEAPVRDARKIGATIKAIPLDRNLRLDLGSMAEASPGAGLIFVCNPNNPTSTVHPAATIAAFVQRVKQATPGVGILIDEAYVDYSVDPLYPTSVPLALEYPGVFVMRTFSKAYGMAGLRLGYAIGQPKTLESLSDAWGMGSVNVLTAAAGLAALNDKAHMDRERQENKRVRDFTISSFKEMGYEVADSQTNFVFVNIRRPAKEFREACARHGVLVARDFPPLEKTHARISIGTWEEMHTAMDVFRRVLGAPATSVAG
jgi:histidinol-phosphate aminotransferase